MDLEFYATCGYVSVVVLLTWLALRVRIWRDRG